MSWRADDTGRISTLKLLAPAEAPQRGRLAEPAVGAPRRVRGLVLLTMAVLLPVVALVAALLGFGGIAGTAMEAAKIVFFVAIALFLISAVFGVMRGRAPRL